MRIHHNKHVANLSAALEGSEWADHPIEQLLAGLDALPETGAGQ
jgi:Fe-Mn family superoxide dismutase